MSCCVAISCHLPKTSHCLPVHSIEKQEERTQSVSMEPTLKFGDIVWEMCAFHASLAGLTGSTALADPRQQS